MKKRKSPSLAPSGGSRASPAQQKDGRVRPTNNQLLYKTHLRWDKHYTYGTNPALNLPSETPGFPSVTSAFLRVLSALQKAEEDRCGRSILQLLSTNTRRTKVVELSSGTHRVPDELKKHYLSDATGGQYSTNLDRNRYGQDDNYLFTVIRYDLEFLGLCPCLVDVEIVDVKAGNQSIIVSAGEHYCKCRQNMPGAGGQCEGQQSTANGQPAPAATQSRRGGRHHGPAPSAHHRPRHWQRQLAAPNFAHGLQWQAVRHGFRRAAAPARAAACARCRASAPGAQPAAPPAAAPAAAAARAALPLEP